jgi:hypothetical protein
MLFTLYTYDHFQLYILNALYIIQMHHKSWWIYPQNMHVNYVIFILWSFFFENDTSSWRCIEGSTAQMCSFNYVWGFLSFMDVSKSKYAILNLWSILKHIQP